MGILNIDEHIEEHRQIGIRYPDIGYPVTAQTNPLTGGVELSLGGKTKYVPDIGPRTNLITTPSALLFDLTNSSIALGGSNRNLAYDTTVTRWADRTLKVTPTTASAVVTKGSQSLSLDATDQLLSVDVYIPAVVSGSASINVILYNSSSYSSTYTSWGFNQNALRQGWNTLKCWCGDTVSASAGTGMLKAGATKGNGAGGAFDPASPIGYFEILIQNASGADFYFDGLRKGAKALPVLVMGFDATGIDTADDIFTRAGGVADFMQSKGIRGYFTATYIYDLLYPTNADAVRKDVLYHDFGWDCLPHFWNHGGSYPGQTITATSVGRTSNVVTFTKAAHAIPVGTVFYGNISGATPSDINGLQRITVTTTSAMTYTAAGADGAATGTIVLNTKTEAVINADNATTRAILRHELVDLQRLIRSRGWTRAAHIGAYPNNTVGELSVHQAICAEAGIKYFRSIKGRSSAVTEFGVDNPLHFGSMEMGSGSTATSLQNVIDALNGAIGRGEHLWTYGHYIQDETTAGGAVDLDYAPGQNGNPSAPTGGDGGWWYLGQLKKFVNDTVAPLVASSSLVVMTPYEWSECLGNIDGSR